MDFHRAKIGKNKFKNKSRDQNTPASFRNSRYSRDDKESAIVTCADCGIECKVPFVPKTDRPVYCSDCFRQAKSQDFESDPYSRDDRNSRYSRDDRNSRYSRDDRNSRYSRDDKESTIVTCADCGIECKVPFVPKTDRPVYCSDCFRQAKSQDFESDPYSRDDRNSRYSRDDRNSRYSRDDRSSRYPNEERKSKEGRNNNRTKLKEKLTKKQESFFSGGSDKFYNTLKEKLFENLGGKICASCGFRDERALGFRSIYDDESFDNIKRGGFASSWGKYISDPDLARRELKILCLNCNELSKSTPPLEKKSDRLKKKRKRFPR